MLALWRGGKGKPSRLARHGAMNSCRRSVLASPDHGLTLRSSGHQDGIGDDLNVALGKKRMERETYFARGNVKSAIEPFAGGNRLAVVRKLVDGRIVNTGLNALFQQVLAKGRTPRAICQQDRKDVVGAVC